MGISPVMSGRAQQKMKAAGLDVELTVADAGHLPFSDASFDVVSSNFGVVFASDVRGAARELARVCRQRLGYTVWHALPKLEPLYARFARQTSHIASQLSAQHPSPLLITHY